MSITTGLHARLTAALGPDVAVLLPEQMELPRQGRTPGQPGGLPGWLAQHPAGYVQLYDPSMGYSLGGWADNLPVQIDTVATTREQALELANKVRDLLAYSPRRGGNRESMTPPFVSSADASSVRVTQRFNVRQAYIKGSEQYA